MKKKYCILSDFTIDFLKNEFDDDLHEVIPTRFNEVYQVLTQPKFTLDDNINKLIIWSRPQAVLSSFNEYLETGFFNEDKIMSEIDQFANLINESLTWAKQCIVFTWDLPNWYCNSPLSFHNFKHDLSWSLNKINNYLITRLRDINGIQIFDISQLLKTGLNQSYSPKLWYLGKIPYTREIFLEAAAIIKNDTDSADRQIKCIAVDLDNTLWGGIVGDDGRDNLILGAPDSNGEAYLDFQKALKYFQAQGILLVILSKNDEKVALDAIEKHPEMLLKRSDFTSWRINWNDKADNLISIAEELNIGLDSFVFIDDNLAERDFMASALPEVMVPAWPQDPALYASTLLDLNIFNISNSTSEDLNRTEMYKEENSRRESLKKSINLSTWLKDLNIKITTQNEYDSNSSRIIQLINKTNQFNLKTRRLKNNEFLDWINQGDRHIITFNVQDKFGKYGLVALATVEVENSIASVCDFIMSCRVFGRKIEHALTYQIIQLAKEKKATKLLFELIPSERNDPCKEFLENEFSHDEINTYSFDLNENYIMPDFIQFEEIL